MDREDIWKSLSEGAIKRDADFSVDSVMKHWKRLFEDLTHTKSI